MPAGGVRDLAEGHMMCHVHGEERVIFQCRQCDQVICIRCKLTRHEGHFTQDLSEVAAEGKEKIKKGVTSPACLYQKYGAEGDDT